MERAPAVSSDASPERIRNAAVLYKGNIYEGTTHGHAFGALLKRLKIEDPELYKKVGGDEYRLVEELESLPHENFDFEGFVTSNGRYVTRGEATGLAQAARQLTRDKPPGSSLFSEDVRG